MSPIKPGGPAEPDRETCNNYVPYYIIGICGSGFTGVFWDLVGHVDQKVLVLLCPLLHHLLQGCHGNLEDLDVQCNLERQTVSPTGGQSLRQTGKKTGIQGVRETSERTDGRGCLPSFPVSPFSPGVPGFWGTHGSMSPAGTGGGQ